MVCGDTEEIGFELGGEIKYEDGISIRANISKLGNLGFCLNKNIDPNTKLAVSLGIDTNRESPVSYSKFSVGFRLDMINNN